MADHGKDLQSILTKYGVPEGKLGSDELVYVNAALTTCDLAGNWDHIGTTLEVASIAAIKASNTDDGKVNIERCLIDMLENWLRTAHMPRWRDVVGVALQYSGGQPAEEIAKNSKDPHKFFIQTAPVAGVNFDDVDDSLLKSNKDIVEALHEAGVTDKCLEIGLFLGITISNLSKPKILDMVSSWTKWSYDYGVFGKPSWRRLVRAIGARAGGNAPTKAQKIAAAHKASAGASVLSTRTVTSQEQGPAGAGVPQTVDAVRDFCRAGPLGHKERLTQSLICGGWCLAVIFGLCGIAAAFTGLYAGAHYWNSPKNTDPTEPPGRLSAEDFDGFPEPTLLQLNNFLSSEVAVKWEQIGEALQIKQGVLSNIGANNAGYQDWHERCLREVFKKWYSGMTTEFSWRKIAEILLSMDEARVVEHLYKKLKEN